MTYTSKIGQYANTIRSDALKPSPSQENSRHQLRVMENLAKHKLDLEAARLSLRDLSSGVVVSDYGKTKEAKDLLLQQGDDSELLITSLQGKAINPSAALIKDLLISKFGAEHSSMLNPNLSTEEIRQQFQADPKLLGFFHELPGLLLLIKDFNAGEMNKEEFRTQFWSTFAHNGPQKGFWNTLTGMINQGREAKGLTLHLGTPFSNKQGEFIYPNPNDEALLHTAYDRLDQGLEGLPKIAKEVAAFQDIKDLNDNLLGTNNAWTIEQLDTLRQLAAKSIEAKPELGFMGQAIDAAKSTIQRFGEFVKTRLNWDTSNGEQLLSFKHPDGSTETLRKRGENYYEHNIAVTQPATRSEFMSNNAAQFLSRVVRNFKEEDRYAQAV